MARRLIDAGFPAADVTVLGPNDRKGNMVARYRGKPGSKLKPVLIIGHTDVVEAKREDWTTDPFQFVEKDGYYYGRGTQDMKDSDAIAVAAFIRLKKEGFVPDRDIILALTADEEGGTSNGVSWLLQKSPGPGRRRVRASPGFRRRRDRARQADVRWNSRPPRSLYGDSSTARDEPGRAQLAAEA